MPGWLPVLLVVVVGLIGFAAGLVWGSRRRGGGEAIMRLVAGFFGFYAGLIQRLSEIKKVGGGRLEVEEDDSRGLAFLPTVETRETQGG